MSKLKITKKEKNDINIFERRDTFMNVDISSRFFSKFPFSFFGMQNVTRTSHINHVCVTRRQCRVSRYLVTVGLLARKIFLCFCENENCISAKSLFYFSTNIKNTYFDFENIYGTISIKCRVKFDKKEKVITIFQSLFLFARKFNYSKIKLFIIQISMKSDLV